MNVRLAPILKPSRHRLGKDARHPRHFAYCATLSAYATRLHGGIRSYTRHTVNPARASIPDYHTHESVTPRQAAVAAPVANRAHDRWSSTPPAVARPLPAPARQSHHLHRRSRSTNRPLHANAVTQPGAPVAQRWPGAAAILLPIHHWPATAAWFGRRCQGCHAQWHWPAIPAACRPPAMHGHTAVPPRWRHARPLHGSARAGKSRLDQCLNSHAVAASCGMCETPGVFGHRLQHPVILAHRCGKRQLATRVARL